MSSLKDRALEIKNELKKGKNTAQRVGGVLADMVDYMENIPSAQVDDSLSDTSENPVQNKVIKTALDTKQETLVSGTNLKTINDESLLGSGNIVIQGGGSVTIDPALDASSPNAVANSAITVAINNKQDTLVSGVNIKTINNVNILGEGNISVQGEKGDKGDKGDTGDTDN